MSQLHPDHRKTRLRTPVLLPLAIAAAIAVVDQLTKAFVIARQEVGGGSLQTNPRGDLIQISVAHNVRLAFAHSGTSTDPRLTVLVNIVIIAAVSAFGLFLVLSSRLSAAQRWTMAGILGGGIGNLIDRFVRSGAVDFIRIGASRVVFNVADIAICAFGISFIIITVPRFFKKRL